MSASLVCPRCHCSEHQVKNGMAPSGNARFKCQNCGRTYSLSNKPHGYDAGLRLQAVKMYLDGLNFRRVARLLSVNPQSVANWVNAYHQNQQEIAGFPHHNTAKPALTTQPHDECTQTASLEVLEGDELYTFLQNKKTKSM